MIKLQKIIFLFIFEDLGQIKFIFISITTQLFHLLFYSFD